MGRLRNQILAMGVATVLALYAIGVATAPVPVYATNYDNNDKHDDKNKHYDNNDKHDDKNEGSTSSSTTTTTNGNSNNDLMEDTGDLDDNNSEDIFSQM